MPQAQSADTVNILAIIQSMRQDLNRIEAILIPADPEDKYDLNRLDTASPSNKSDKFLSERGIEVCYRLFDMGKTRYEVAQLMSISFGAATHRHKNWEELGGNSRTIRPIDDEAGG